MIQRISLCAAASLVWVAGIRSLPAQNETYSIFSVFNDQVGQVYLNGFPLLQDDGSSDGTVATTTLVNQNVIKGENVFRIELADRFDPDTSAVVPGVLKLRVDRGSRGDDQRIESFMVERETRDNDGRVEEMTKLSAENGFEGEARGVLDDERSTLTFDTAVKGYDYSQDNAQPVNVIEIRFTATNVPLATLPWIGPPVALTPADETAIRGVVAQLIAALQAEDAAVVLQLITSKVQRLAAALEVTVADMEGNLTSFWNILFNDAQFAFANVDAAELEFESFPGVNLVRVMAPDGSAPITGSGGGKQFALPLFFSKIGGTWVIVD